MAHGKTTPVASRREGDRWARVSFLTGKLAAGTGSERSNNPHPTDSASAKGWLDGWLAYAGDSPKRPASPIPLPPNAAAADSVDRPPLRPESDLTMDLIERLPGMADIDLGTLIANAERLAQNGTAKQKTAAQAALPAIQAEMAARLARKADEAPAKAAPRARRKAPAAAAQSA